MTMNIPANIAPAKAPAPQNRLGADLIAMYLNRLETSPAGHFSISEQQAPAGTDREALVSRSRELATAVSEGSEPKAVVQRVARLFMRFPSSRLPEEVAKATMAAYAQDLMGFPLWVIDKAFQAVIAGQAGTSPTFVPSSIELRKTCERELNPVRDEISDINKILNAETYRDPPPEEKAKVAAQFRELVEELKLNVDLRDTTAKARRPLTRNEAQAALDAIDPTQPLPKFSPSLRKSLGLPEQEAPKNSPDVESAA